MSAFRRSCDLKITFVGDGDGGYTIEDIKEIKPEPATPNRLSSKQWFEEEWSCRGEDLLPSSLLGYEQLTVRGYVWSERIDSIDYGTDYDGGFEVEKVLRKKGTPPKEEP